MSCVSGFGIACAPTDESYRPLLVFGQEPCTYINGRRARADSSCFFFLDAHVRISVKTMLFTPFPFIISPRNIYQHFGVNLVLFSRFPASSLATCSSETRAVLFLRHLVDFRPDAVSRTPNITGGDPQSHSRLPGPGAPCQRAGVCAGQPTMLCRRCAHPLPLHPHQRVHRKATRANCCKI